MSNEGTSSELQEIVLSSLLKNSYLLSKVKNDIKISSFDKLQYKLIYKSLIYYYNKYSQLPSFQTLLITIDDLYTQEYGDKSEVTESLVKLYNTPLENEDFIVDQLTRFIKRMRIEDVLSNYLPKFKNGEKISIDRLGEDLASSVSIDLHKSNAFKLSDNLSLPEVRRESVGSDDNPKIIKSVFNAINNALLFKGFKIGDVVTVCAKPGCFTGDTKVLIADDGTSCTLEELYNERYSELIYGFDYTQVKTGRYKNVQLSKLTDDLMVLNINGVKLRCTPDHKFMMSNCDYKEACKLREGDYILGMKRTDNNDYDVIIDDQSIILTSYKVNSVSRVKLKDKIPVYDIVDSDVNNNFAVALSETEGIFVHNCGKTMYMVSECSNAALMGNNALHLFVGDMTKYDGFIRYTSNITGINQDEVVMMDEVSQVNLIKKCNYNGHFDRLAVESYSAGEITINQLIDNIFKIQDELKIHFDMIAIDYPDNLIRESDMMYESGGEIYNKISYLARRNKSVVITGSQPKQSYWNSEIIPLDGCAESSRKQQVIDCLITLGRPYNDCNLLTGFLAKVRRGTVGGIFRIETEFTKARMKQISELDYLRIKNDYENNSIK